MRTNGELERDANVVSALKSIAKSLNAIAEMLVYINAKLEPPKVIIPEERGDLCHEE